MADIQTIIVQAISIALASLLLYTTYGIIWRLYRSPISHFPGPKLAALTYWYEFYYDVFPNYGQYTFHIGDLHKKYGPIVRINPYELHISTPQFYETLYSSSKKRDKLYWFTKMFGVNYSAFATVEHSKHRERRAALNPFFSAASARRLQPVVEERVRACIERLRTLRESGDVLRLVIVVSAFANGKYEPCGYLEFTNCDVDVVMMYAFGRNFNRLEQPDFDAAGYAAFHNNATLGNLMRHMIWIMRIVKSLPDFVVKKMGADLTTFQKVQAVGLSLRFLHTLRVLIPTLGFPKASLGDN